MYYIRVSVVINKIDSLYFFFNDTATTEIYTLSLHDALPISGHQPHQHPVGERPPGAGVLRAAGFGGVDVLRVGQRDGGTRSEEHTSELQSRQYLVCRLLLEKKKNNILTNNIYITLPSSQQL